MTLKSILFFSFSLMCFSLKITLQLNKQQRLWNSSHQINAFFKDTFMFSQTLFFYYYYHYCDYKCILTITTCCQADARSLLPRRDISIVALLAPISHKQMHLSLFTISPILPLTTHRRRAINAEEEQFIFIACNHSKHPRRLSVPPKSGKEEAKQPSQPPTPPSPSGRC